MSLVTLENVAVSLGARNVLHDVLAYKLIAARS